jgi:tetratricopeptide (TPR) repeat protein
MFSGQSELALRTARELARQIPEEMLKQQVNFLDAFVPTVFHVMVRFGRWEDILAEPEAADYLPVTRAIRHYARALAYAATGRIAEAKAERDRFREVAATVPQESRLFQNESRHVLAVADAMIDGEIAYRQEDYAAAFASLREAVRRDDALNYDEPWGWMQPARHALGALLLEQGQLAEAESVYRTDLERHPKNPWALHGLAECLERQGKMADAALVRTEFEMAVKQADVRIDRSCYCRLGEK